MSLNHKNKDYHNCIENKYQEKQNLKYVFNVTLDVLEHMPSSAQHFQTEQQGKRLGENGFFVYQTDKLVRIKLKHLNHSNTI